MIHLPARQLEVLRLTAEGLTEEEVAALMFVTRSTVRKHKVMIFSKLGAKSSPHAVALAFRRGVLSVEDEDVIGEVA